jgi:hypothetical protein
MKGYENLLICGAGKQQIGLPKVKTPFTTILKPYATFSQPIHRLDVRLRLKNTSS